MRKLNFKKEEIVNKYGIKYIEDVDTIIEPNGRKRRTCRFRCKCGNTFTSRLTDVIGNKRTSCGCRKKRSRIKIYKEGENINGVIFIKSLGVINKTQYALFKCPLCGESWKSSVANIQAKNTRTCCNNGAGWSKKLWASFYKTGLFYKVELYNDTESFIKVGITSKTVEKRLKYIPYKFKVLKIIHGNSEYIYDYEKKFKRIFRKYKYKPRITFGGESECFIKN